MIQQGHYQAFSVDPWTRTDTHARVRVRAHTHTLLTAQFLTLCSLQLEAMLFSHHKDAIPSSKEKKNEQNQREDFGLCDRPFVCPVGTWYILTVKNDRSWRVTESSSESISQDGIDCCDCEHRERRKVSQSTRMLQLYSYSLQRKPVT